MEEPPIQPVSPLEQLVQASTPQQAAATTPSDAGVASTVEAAAAKVAAKIVSR